jgi:quercetin dioxygenase-like cupin family protein
MAKASPQPIVRADLLTAMIGGKSVERVEIKRIDFEPGQIGGLHVHPCPVVGYVASGTILFRIEGEPAQLLPSGSAFYEPANARISHFDNGSEREPATFIAFYLLGEGEEQLIEMLG